MAAPHVVGRLASRAADVMMSVPANIDRLESF